MGRGLRVRPEGSTLTTATSDCASTPTILPLTLRVCEPAPLNMTVSLVAR